MEPYKIGQVVEVECYINDRYKRWVHRFFGNSDHGPGQIGLIQITGQKSIGPLYHIYFCIGLWPDGTIEENMAFTIYPYLIDNLPGYWITNKVKIEERNRFEHIGG